MTSQPRQRQRLPLAVHGDGPLLMRQIDKLVAHIALPRLEAELFDRAADLIEGEVMHRARLGHGI